MSGLLAHSATRIMQSSARKFYPFLILLSLLLLGCSADNADSLASKDDLIPAPGNSDPSKGIEKEIGTTLPSPSEDPSFLVLPDGRNLTNVTVSGSSLRLAYGNGTSFSSSAFSRYQNLFLESQAARARAFPIQWVVVDLESGDELATSYSPDTLFFGASVSKIFVAATLLNQQDGVLSASQLQKMADMLVVSSNTAWKQLQDEIGGGDTFTGQSRIHAFTQSMGYLRTRGFQGWMGAEHGNELTAHEIGRFLTDAYNKRFAGAETLWKLMFTSRTGSTRGKKYIPGSYIVGGKTGTYSGPTVDPETDLPEDEDGNPYRVQVYHHTLVLHHNNKDYAIVVLGNTGSNEDVAVMARGLMIDFVETR